MKPWNGETIADGRVPRKARGRSTDGTKVTMYAQWRSIDDYQAMRQDPAPLPFLQEALTIAKFEPGVYEVVRTFTPAGEPN